MTLTWFHTHFLIVPTAGAFVYTCSVTVARCISITTFGHAAVFTAIVNYQRENTQSIEHVDRMISQI